MRSAPPFPTPCAPVPLCPCALSADPVQRIEEDSSQDTCDWALEAQCMQKQLSLEYRRKAALLQSIQQRWELSGGDDLAVNALTEDFLAECMGKWTADGSCVEEIMRCLS